MIDLHSHSTASDGRLSPTALIERAAARGVARLALTDHDTVAGVPEGRRAAVAHGIELVAGAEISVQWQRRTLHVVGLDLDIAHPTLVTGLDRHQRERDARAAAIARRLATVGLPDGLARARSASAGGQITRAHFADLLIADGLARNRAAAFKRYLAPGRIGHQRAEWASLGEAIDWIHAAGGDAVLAHPFGYGFSGAWRWRAVAAFAAAGGDGLEICTGVSSREQESRASRDAQEYGLAASVGSDFHAAEQFWLDLGCTRQPPARLARVAALAREL